MLYNFNATKAKQTLTLLLTQCVCSSVSKSKKEYELLTETDTWDGEGIEEISFPKIFCSILEIKLFKNCHQRQNLGY